MTRFPGAVWKPITRNFTNQVRPRTDCVILHVDAGNSNSLQGWFNNPAARASSHLYVKKDGTIEQYIDMNLISWANGDGNNRSVTVETQGYGHGEWTEAQLVSLVKIIQWVNSHYGVPIVAMKDSKRTSKGVGWHKLGVPANSFQKAQRISQTGGECWSSAVGKICPGPDRIKQIPALIARAQGGKIPASATKPVPSKHKSGRVPGTKITVTVDGDFGKWSITALQQVLRNKGYKAHAVDGAFGAYTIRSLQSYLRDKGQRGHAVDGAFGAYTIRSLQAYLRARGYKAHAVDGAFGAYTKRSLQEALIDGRF